MTTQVDTLAAHLKKHKTITRRQADTEYSIQSLTKRISELREMGFEIKSQFKRNPITNQRYMQYQLEN